MQGERYTDLSITLSTFLMKYIGLWTAKNYVEERRRKLGIAYTIFIVFLCLYVQSRDMYFSWGELSGILYTCCNFLSVALTSFKVYVLLLRRTELGYLIFYMQEHFWNCKYDEQEKLILADCRKTCMVFTVTVICLGECVFAAFMVAPICASIGKNETDRIHPFNMWMAILLETPYYEMFFVVEKSAIHYVTNIKSTSFSQALAILHIGVCYFCFDNMFSILSMHLATQFRILRYRMEILCTTITDIDKSNVKTISSNHARETYKKFVSCVRQHEALINYCMLLEKVFTSVTFGQVTVFSVLICLFGYQILLAQSTLGRRSIYMLLLVGSTCILFMFTYSCHGLMEESDKVGESMYSTMWTQVPMNKHGLMLRKDLTMVILRSRRICCITAYGFFPVSIETFSTILSTAASYFTLLRNTLEG